MYICLCCAPCGPDKKRILDVVRREDGATGRTEVAVAVHVVWYIVVCSVLYCNVVWYSVM